MARVIRIGIELAVFAVITGCCMFGASVAIEMENTVRRYEEYRAEQSEIADLLYMGVQRETK